MPACSHQARYACPQGRSVGEEERAMQKTTPCPSLPRHPTSAHLVQCVSLGLLAKVFIHPRVGFHHPGLYAPFSFPLAILALQPSFGSSPIVLSSAEGYPRQAPDRPLRYVKPARGLIHRQSGGYNLFSHQLRRVQSPTPPRKQSTSSPQGYRAMIPEAIPLGKKHPSGIAEYMLTSSHSRTDYPNELRMLSPADLLRASLSGLGVAAALSGGTQASVTHAS